MNPRATDYTLYGWHRYANNPRWVALGSYADESDAIAAVPGWMGTYDAYKVDQTVYRFGDLEVEA